MEDLPVAIAMCVQRVQDIDNRSGWLYSLVDMGSRGQESEDWVGCDVRSTKKRNGKAQSPRVKCFGMAWLSFTGHDLAVILALQYV